jgi:hypothetical protein
MSNKSKIELDDFISPEREIDIGIKINPKARIVDFADIRVSAIDPNIRGAINWHLSNAKSKLQRLKDLFDSNK